MNHLYLSLILVGVAVLVFACLVALQTLSDDRPFLSRDPPQQATAAPHVNTGRDQWRHD